MCAGLASLVSASIRTVHVDTSTKMLVIGMASGPGLISPVTFLPSQFMTRVIGFRCVAVGPQSPDQVPVRGCPCWAEQTAARAAHRPIQKTVRRLMLASGPAPIAAARRFGGGSPGNRSALGQQLGGIFVDVFPLPAAAVAGRAPHRVIDGRIPARIGFVDVGALAQQVFDYFIPAPKGRAVQRSLAKAAR